MIVGFPPTYPAGRVSKKNNFTPLSCDIIIYDMLLHISMHLALPRVAIHYFNPWPHR